MADWCEKLQNQFVFTCSFEMFLFDLLMIYTDMWLYSNINQIIIYIHMDFYALLYSVNIFIVSPVVAKPVDLFNIFIIMIYFRLYM